MFQLFKRFKRSEKGQGMVEYGLILALVSIVALGALGSIGGKLNDTFDKVVGVVSDGEIIPEDEILYTDEDIDGLVAEGYIPIATPDELDSLRKDEAQTFGQGTKWEGEYTSGLDKNYIQVADIDLDGKDNFEPIGTTDTANSFKGTFDGGGYTISNLTVDKGSDNFAGLFGRAEGASFKNIGLEDVNVKGNNYVGGLVGHQRNSSKVINSYAMGTVTGTSRVYCYVGGLVGDQSSSSKVISSYATGTVTGATDVGGLVGRQNDGSLITSSYATGNVTGTGSYNNYAGGLVGYQYNSSKVINSYATGNVTGNSYVGGLVGRQYDGSLITSSYATGNVTGTYYWVGGLVGSEYSSSTTSSYYDTETTGQTKSDGGTGRSTDEMKNKDTYVDWDFKSVWTIESGQYPTHR